MDFHEFKLGPNGLCEVCGKTKKKCMLLDDVYLAGVSSNQELSVNSVISKFSQVPEECEVKQIACTKLNTFVLSLTGKVYSMGETTSALGRSLERKEDSRVAKLVYSLREHNIVKLSCGEDHLLALSSEGQVWVWGSNKFGQLGLGDQEPRNLPTLLGEISHVHSVWAGHNCSFALTKTGSLYAWGDNKSYQLGLKNTSKKFRFLTPQEVENVPWTRNTNLEISGSNVTYFYKTQSLQEKFADYSNHEKVKLSLENEKLQRKLGTMKEKIEFLKHKLDEKTEQEEVNLELKPDLALQEIQNLIKNNKHLIKQKKRELKDKEKVMISVSKEIDTISKNLEDLEKQENEYRDQFDKKENELKKFKKELLQDSKQLSEIKSKRDMFSDLLKSIESTKYAFEEQLSTKQIYYEQVSNQKKTITSELSEAQKKEIIYQQMEVSRQKELKRQYFDKQHTDVENQLLELVSIHESLADASLEKLSSSLNLSSTHEYVEASNQILKQVLKEIQNTKRRTESFILETLMKVWGVLEDNINMRIQLNENLLALTLHTSKKLLNFQQELKEPKQLSGLEYAKSFFKKTNIQLKETKLEAFETSKPPKTRGNSWFCS